jgi:hypothetical protein
MGAIPDPYQCKRQHIPHLPASQHVEQAVAQHAEAWAAKIGTKATAQFKEDAAAALHQCLRKHINTQNSQFNRISDLRREFSKLANQATAAAKKLREVQATLDRVPPMYHDPAFRMHPLGSTEYDLFSMAEAARQHADKAVDRGGQNQMWAFAALAQGLIIAYRHATGKSGAGRSARHGPLLDLVGAVVLTARKIAKDVTGKPLKTPTARKAAKPKKSRLPANDESDEALGEYLNRIAGRIKET